MRRRSASFVVARVARDAATHADEEADIERRGSLAEERVGAVLAVLKAESARSVLDLGCGEGRFLRALLADTVFERIVGVSHRALERASERLRLEDMPARRRERISLLHGALWCWTARSLVVL